MKKNNVRLFVNTRSYLFAHGHVPRGVGYWAFEIDDHGTILWAELDGQKQLTFADAKRGLKRQLEEMGMSGAVFVAVAT